MNPTEEPRVVERLWPDPRRGPFKLRLSFGRLNDRPAVVGVEMWGIAPPGPEWATKLPSTPETPIGAEDIRLPLGKLLDDWVGLHLSAAKASRKLYGDLPGHDETVRRFEGRFEGKRTGRPRLSDEFLEQVTAIYNAAVASGSRRPALRVRDELGPVSPETARGWIRLARQRGLPVVAAPNMK